MNDVSILSVAKYCGVQIYRTGKYYIAHCPFHGKDTEPSLTFYPEGNGWVCYGKCEGKGNKRNGGGPVQFVQQYYNYNYHEAKEWIEQRFGQIQAEKFEELPKIPPKPVPHPWVIYWHSILGDNRLYFNQRGFTDDFINREFWGWDGHRYTLPVWEGQPGESEVLGVRRRKVDGTDGEKYLGLKDHNPPTVWGRWYCLRQNLIFAFAGEFDAALANQYGLPSFSIVNGVNSLLNFPSNWPDLWFPDSKRMIVVFDRKEERFGSQLCSHWNKCKGTMMARLFHWPLSDEYKDFSEFMNIYGKNDFLKLAKLQRLIE